MKYQWNIIGHDPILKQLEKDIESQLLHHAYLFVGPACIGKTRVAKTLAGILQCPHRYCRSCPSCIQIEKGCHLDTMMLSDNGESIKIGEIREIIERLSMTGQSPYKILLIERIERMTDEAANGLLKTLEEPSGKTIFLFTAEQVSNLLPTIVSRMRMIKFQQLPDDILTNALADRFPHAEKELIQEVAMLSLGRSGRALQLMEDPELLHEIRSVLQEVFFIAEKASLATRMQKMLELLEDELRLKQFFDLLTAHYRMHALGTDDKKRLRAIGILFSIHRTSELLRRNVNPRLALEHLMLHL